MMKHTIPLVYVTAFLFLFGETLQPAPRIAIYESIVCDQYYADKTQNGPFDCKIPPVQQELAFLGGIERLSIIIPSILASPFAALADRYGHSLVLSLAIFGVFLEDGWPFIVCWFPQIFPIRLIWLHFFFSLLGGGFTVVVTLLHVIIAHVVSPEERTKIFFRARAAGVGASILGYAASGFAMRVNSWLPWAIGLGSLCLATLSAKMIPHTIAQEQEHHQDTDPECGAFTQSLQVRLLSSARAMWHSARILVCNKQVAIMLAMVFLCQLGYDSVPLMMAMYISKRFHWSFSDVSCAMISITHPCGI
jgi:MFS family permease